MSVTIRYLGVAAFQLYTSSGKSILIDPYLDDCPVAPVKADQIDRADLILVSHGSVDHVGDTARIAKRLNSKIICGSDVKELLIEQGVDPANIRETIWGVLVEQCGIKVRAVESRHRSCVTLKSGKTVYGIPLGFIIYLEDGIRVYNASDTAIFSDLKLYGELYRPHIGFLNMSYPEIDTSLPGIITSLSGEMSPYEAALAAQWLNLDCAVACHYTNPDCADVKQFVELLRNMRSDDRPYVKPVAMRPGETFVYTPGNQGGAAL